MADLTHANQIAEIATKAAANPRLFGDENALKQYEAGYRDALTHVWPTLVKARELGLLATCVIEDL